MPALAKRNEMNEMYHIGWKEKVDLPDWGISGLLAKSDTGAKSCAIDVTDLKELSGNKVSFHVRVKRKPEEVLTKVEADIVKRTNVRSSNGQRAERLFVKTRLKVGPVEKDVMLGLVCRKSMICRLLIGREALANDFLVDCSQKHLHKD